MRRHHGRRWTTSAATLALVLILALTVIATFIAAAALSTAVIAGAVATALALGATRAGGGAGRVSRRSASRLRFGKKP